MESLQGIKRRIKGITNINQITKAMELVAATRMRRSQETALASRPYAFTALDFLATLSRLEGVTLPPLLEKREVKHSLIVLVTSDKGLAGSFNANVIREFEKMTARENIDLRDPRYRFIAVGQKAAGYLERRTGSLLERYLRVGDYATVEQIEPLAHTLIRGFLNKDWDEVRVFSTHFQSALRQTVVERKILPVEYENLRKTAKETVPEKGRFAELVREKAVPFFDGLKGNMPEYLIEPSPEVILGDLAAHLVVMQVYHLILEANASEHAARRMAMKSASDNAEELAHGLTLLYNKSRQAAITKEIIEITAGAESLK